MNKQTFKNIGQALILAAKNTLQENVFIRAGSLAYTTIISLIPAIVIVLYALKHFVSNSPEITNVLQTALSKYLLPSTSRATITWVFDAAALVSNNISYMGIAAFIVTLLLLARELEGHILALCKQTCNWYISAAHYLGFIFVSCIYLGVVYGAYLLLSPILSAFPKYIANVDYPFILLGICNIALLRAFSGYYLKWRAALLGTCISALLLCLSWKICSYYFLVSVSYAAYGSLIFIPTFLLWIYIVWCCMLYGAAVAVSYQDLSSPPEKGLIDDI